MKRVLNSTLATCAFLLISMLSRGAFAAPILQFDTSSNTPGVGDSITIDIIISDVAELYGFNLDIAYNASILQFSAPALPGTLLNSAGITLGELGLLGFDASVPGQIQDINDSLLGPGAGAFGSGLLASLNFDVIATGTADIAFLNINSLAGSELINSAGLSIPITAINTQITVASSQVPLPATLYLLVIGALSLLIINRRA